jgi:hypothetical protein
MRRVICCVGLYASSQHQVHLALGWSRIIIPCRAVERASASLGRVSSPLLEEKRHAVVETRIPEVAYPIYAFRPGKPLSMHVIDQGAA